MADFHLNITHLYPDLLNLYGDRGNILCLQKRCEWRGIGVTVTQAQLDDDLDLSEVDILFLGGGSDREQKIVTRRLLDQKSEIEAYVADDGVLAAICGGYQLIGHYYQLEGEKIEGLSLIDAYTEAKEGRLIGNVVLDSAVFGEPFSIVGFENHAGRTFAGDHTPLGTVTYGYGNNGEDGREGVVYKNIIGTYLHGPLFPKNPKLADEILKRALVRRYGEKAELSALNDAAEERANQYVADRFVKKAAGRV